MAINRTQDGFRALRLLHTAASAVLVLGACLFGCQETTAAPKAAQKTLEPPVSLLANATSESRIELSWSHSGSVITGFLIERSVSSTGGFSKIASVDSGALSFNDSGLAAGTTYYYRVRAYKQTRRSTEYSAYSAIADATIPIPSPAPEVAPAPVLDSVQVSGTDFILRWSQPPSSHGAPDGGYDVFVDGVDQNNHLTELSMTVSGLAYGGHCFYVEARFTEITPSVFAKSNQLCAVLQEPQPEPEPTPSPTPTNTSDASLGYLPVFPGAQGFGTETKAGRGGKIIRVTNLNDSGVGSLRAAVNASGPRTIIFDVAGVIQLGSKLTISEPYITIAGQTAPSPGITLRGNSLMVATHDVLIQHLRVRLGASAGQDGIVFNGGHGLHTNMVLDHLSVSWATDENASAIYQPRDITLSNSILSEGLIDHSMGFLVREHTKHIAMVGNLFAHNKNRNPRVTTGAELVALNNVHYNTGQSYWVEFAPGTHASYFTPHLASVVGSVFLQGPSATKYGWPILVESDVEPGTKIYQSDNIASGGIFRNTAPFDTAVSSPPIWHPSCKPIAGKDVHSHVLRYVGARPADRDAVDLRIVSEVQNGKGGFISSAPSYSLVERHETFVVPVNPNGDDDGDGYTNFEEALHRRAAEVEGR